MNNRNSNQSKQKKQLNSVISQNIQELNNQIAMMQDNLSTVNADDTGSIMLVQQKKSLPMTTTNLGGGA